MSASQVRCPICSEPIAEPFDVCGCATRHPETRLPPPVFISRRDFGRLEHLARVRPAHCADIVARFLVAELDRAIICRDEDLPANAVTMRSRVLFRPDDGRDIESRTLVYPHDYDPSGSVLSILSPIGVALLGLREGASMAYPALDGAVRRVAVEKVAWRPDGRPRFVEPQYQRP
jgi:regulator of nucleoside diphosphate kinase